MLKTTYGKKDLSISRIFKCFGVFKSAEMMWKSGLRNGRKKIISNLQVAENVYIGAFERSSIDIQNDRK
jgi:hypothetical protein